MIFNRKIPRWAVPHLAAARFKGAMGGRASGKSHYFAEQAIEGMLRDSSLRFVCIREVQKSLKFSAKSAVESKIEQYNLHRFFDVRATEILRKNGRGVMIFQGMQDHTADSLKSLEGFGRAWVEEAQNLSERSLELLVPTIRANDSELWFSWNPENKTDPVDKFFRENADDPQVISTKNTYLDNPFCPDVSIQDALRKKRTDPDGYDHIWLGGYNLGGKGRVYSSFSNRPFPQGNIDESVTDHGGDLFVGQDFNVNPMASVIGIRVVDEFHVLDALEIETSNTEEVAREIKRRYPNRYVIFCPDPAGNQRHTNAPVGQTDFTILREAGFEVRAPAAHPPVVDRLNNSNRMFEHEGRRRVRIHPRATAYIDGLSTLTYKPGTSLRNKNGSEHICDAGDYLMWQEFNVLEEQGVWGTSTMSMYGDSKSKRAA